MPRSETIFGLAAAGEVVALVGAPSSGKSALATLAARALSDGSPFLGRPVLRGATIYVAAERAGEVERRLRAAAAPDAAIYVSGSRPQLAEPSSIEELVRAIMAVAEVEPLPIRLIILDTAARCFHGLDENSSRDMGFAAEGMARILDEVPTATLVVVHHMDKLGSSMRGSTALLGAVDLELTVRGSGAIRRLEVTKANAVAEGQRLPFRLTVRKAHDGLDVIAAEAADETGRDGGSKVASRLSPDAQKALDALRDLMTGGMVTFEAWRDATKVRFGDRSPHSKRQAWSKVHRLLLDDGHVVLDGQNVSVSDASSDHQHCISADGGKASAQTVSKAPPIRGAADVADAPRNRARKRGR
nr:AAA family ATPase [Methylobacterium sp. P1-11]